MSQKKAKEQRKKETAVAGKIQITMLANGRVEVDGFPNNLMMAMEVMQAGIRRLAQHFMVAAIEGDVDKDGNLNQSNIIKPKRSGIVLQ